MTFRQHPHGLAPLYLLRILGRLPLGFLYSLAGVGYHLTYSVAGYRRITVRENLAGAFPARSGKELTFLEKKLYRQLTEVAAEIVAARYMSAWEFRRRVTLVNPQLLATASDDGSRPVWLEARACRCCLLAAGDSGGVITKSGSSYWLESRRASRKRHWSSGMWRRQRRR